MPASFINRVQSGKQHFHCLLFAGANPSKRSYCPLRLSPGLEGLLRRHYLALVYWPLAPTIGPSCTNFGKQKAGRCIFIPYFVLWTILVEQALGIAWKKRTGFCIGSLLFFG
jgi:hypothetical protein